MGDSYLILKGAEIPNVCVLSELIEVDDEYELQEGVPLADSFPKEAALCMDSDFPNDTVLADNLINTDMLFVASDRLKKFIEKRQLTHVEYLPVGIIDLKDKRIKQPYFIIHPIDPVDCLDVEKCGPTYSKIDKTNIRKVKRLVFDESKLDPNRQIFRPLNFYRVILVKSELAQAIDNEGFTGIRWVNPKDFSGGQ